MILMKSISRLSRNTLDALTIYNEVVLRGIELRFELENLSTNDKRVRKMFSTLAAVAQNEGWTRSEDVKWGMQQQARKGKAILNHTHFLGYTKDKAGQLVIIEDEAEVVRLIYSLYLEGRGYRQIKKHLEEKKIRTVSGKAEWSTSTIDRILSNEKYVGLLVTQKTYVKDFLDGRQCKNKGELTQYVFENHHEAIIEPEIFERVQQEKQRRSLKQEQSPDVQMLDETVAHFQNYMRVFHAEETDRSKEYLFYTVSHGERHRMSSDNLARLISKYSSLAEQSCFDVPQSVHPHMFRHSRAVILYHNGMGLPEISRFLGHANVETTIRFYARLGVEDIRQVMIKANAGGTSRDVLTTPYRVTDEETLKRLVGLK